MNRENNLDIFNAGRAVPSQYVKPIDGGKLGKAKLSTINNEWRIMKLTEIFGPVGIGWYFEITKEEFVPLPEGLDTIACFVEIALYVRDGDNWSQPIVGTGGATLLSQTSSGPFINPDCRKSAISDALSVITKYIGIGADVYLNENDTPAPKNKNDVSAPKNTAAATKPSAVLCEECGKTITDVIRSDGTKVSAAELIARSTKKYNRKLCVACAKKLAAATEGETNG